MYYTRFVSKDLILYPKIVFLGIQMVTSYKDKVKLQAWISKDLYEQLESLIKLKYRGFRGVLSAEVEAALWAWVSTHKNTQNEFSINGRVNPLPKYYRVFQQCKKFIQQRYGINFEEVHQIPLKYLKEAIEFIRGTDQRTIRKWLKIFESQGLIRFVSPAVVEVRG